MLQIHGKSVVRSGDTTSLCKPALISGKFHPAVVNIEQPSLFQPFFKRIADYAYYSAWPLAGERIAVEILLHLLDGQTNLIVDDSRTQREIAKQILETQLQC